MITIVCLYALTTDNIAALCDVLARKANTGVLYIFADSLCTTLYVQFSNLNEEFLGNLKLPLQKGWWFSRSRF